MGCGKKDDFDRDINCVCEVVRAIKDIQDSAEDNCECPTNCFSEPLGSLVSPISNRVDTRVFVLKTKDGSPFHAFFRNHDCACISIFFRVEDIFDKCCAVLRVLEPLKVVHTSPLKFETVNLAGDKGVDLGKICKVDDFRATNDCITVDLSCFCAVQCLKDVHLGICD
ncbi:spore coat protein CotZ [Bacillaceae bacterium Marseille-Q3522]|nr:spore coat protein CotZ [Bacillaceae bacterium Marseille-Q3522]